MMLKHQRSNCYSINQSRDFTSTCMKSCIPMKEFKRTENVSTIPDLGQSDFPAVDKIHVTCDGVLKLLQNIEVKKATGPDNLPARVLKEFAEEITPVLTYIFQKSLDSGNLPSDCV